MLIEKFWAGLGTGHYHLKLVKTRKCGILGKYAEKVRLTTNYFPNKPYFFNKITIMQHRFFQMALVVKDYDEAIEFYTKKLHFQLIEDTPLSPEKRWVVISPTGEGGANLLLAKAKNDEQLAAVGNQTGGRVFLFMHTDDLERDYENLLANAVEIVRAPSVHEYGKVLVFKDLYGNMWDLIEPIV